MRQTVLIAALIAALPARAADWLYLTNPGDTLSGIGAKYLKNPRDWPKVQAANRVPMPRHLPANTRIRIPVHLLKVTPAPVTVTAVNGSVRVKTADGPYRALTAGALLTGGETVLSGPGASAAFRFADGTALTQMASSKLSFGRLAAYGETGMVATELKLASGRLEARAAKQLAPAGGFRVTTPVAVAGLRGTGFRLNVADCGKSLHSEVMEGRVAVSAQDREVAVDAGYGTVTEKGKPPQSPRPLLPAPDLGALPGRIERLPIGFTWPAMAAATAWRAQLSDDAAFGTILQEARGQTPSAHWDVELADGRYWLRVRGIDTTGLEGLDTVHAFDLDARPLPPAAISPVLGERLLHHQVELAWTSAAGAAGYLLQIAPTPEFGAGMIERRLAAVTRHAESLPEGHWHWRLASLDAAGAPRAFGPHRAFHIQPLPAAPAGLAASSDHGTARFTWAAVPGAARYAFELGRQAEHTAPILRRHTELTHLTAQLEPGRYYWRVHGVEAGGQTGAWSGTGKLILPPRPPEGLAATRHGDWLNVSWQGDAGAFLVELAGDPGFARILDTRRTADGHILLKRPAPGRYWLRVRGIGEEEVIGPAGAALEITETRGFPWWLLPALLLVL